MWRPRSQIVLVVAEVNHAAGSAQGIAEMVRVCEQVAADAAAGAREQANGAGAAEWIVAGVLERFPRAFQEVALLRIDDGRLARRVVKEAGVEPLDVRDRIAGPDVARVVPLCVRHAGGAQLRLVGVLHGVHAGAEIAPELAGAVRAGKAAGHADDIPRSLSTAHWFMLALAVVRTCPRSAHRPPDAGAPRCASCNAVTGLLAVRKPRYALGSPTVRMLVIGTHCGSAAGDPQRVRCQVSDRAQVRRRPSPAARLRQLLGNLAYGHGSSAPDRA